MRRQGTAKKMAGMNFESAQKAPFCTAYNPSSSSSSTSAGISEMTIHSKPQLPEQYPASSTTEQPRASITTMAASLTSSKEERAEKVHETFVILNAMVDIDFESDDDFTGDLHPNMNYKRGTFGLYGAPAEIKSIDEIVEEVGNVKDSAQSNLMQPRSGKETIAGNGEGDHTSSTMDLHFRGMKFVREVEAGTEGSPDGNDREGARAVVSVAANDNGLNDLSNDENRPPSATVAYPRPWSSPSRILYATFARLTFAGSTSPTFSALCTFWWSPLPTLVLLDSSAELATLPPALSSTQVA